MAPDEEEDLYDDEFDFVDDEDDEAVDRSESDEEESHEGNSKLEDKPAAREASPQREPYDGADEAYEDEHADEFERLEPVATHVVHIYEYRQLKRTIDRPFTAEDAEAFASEYNRTAKPYGRFAVAGKNDAKPRKSLD
jgi:hypothetical protein